MTGGNTALNSVMIFQVWCYITGKEDSNKDEHRVRGSVS